MKKITFKSATTQDIEQIKCFVDEDKKKAALRHLREKECYVYVNRGEAWYKRLTEEQKAEFDQWYQAWLDVTKTLETPIKPEWLR